MQCVKTAFNGVRKLTGVPQFVIFFFCGTSEQLWSYVHCDASDDSQALNIRLPRISKMFPGNLET